MVPMPFLNANKFVGKMELDSNHQSRLVLSMYSKILRRKEESAIGQKELLELDLGLGITR